MNVRIPSLAALAVLAAACADGGTPSSAPPIPASTLSQSQVTPVFVAGNISGPAAQVCNASPVNTTGGYWFGYKVEGAVDGGEGGVATMVSTDGRYLSWSAAANLLVQAVLVKGGTNQHIYGYGGTFSGDAELVSPLNAGGNVPTISHYIVCYTAQLGVSKTATTSFDREYTWGIGKTADASALTLTPNESHPVNYAVQLSAAWADHNHAVAGTITVVNPAPVAVEITAVTDQLSSGESPQPDCGVEMPYSLPAGGTLGCTYASGLANADPRTNTASAATATPGVQGGSGQAAVAFGAPTSQTDACVALSDTYAGAGLPAQVCYTDLTGGTRTWSYARVVGPFGVGTYTVANTASFATPRDVQGSATADVVVTVPATGCTLTQGYWKNHADPNSRRYDPTWNYLPQSSATVFASSGQSWLTVFRTAPAGNGYYTLAHQYMAARLNGLAGAGTTPAVDAALAGAAVFFSGRNPATKLTSAEKASAQTWAGLLAQYNEGSVGPGHCSEPTN